MPLADAGHPRRFPGAGRGALAVAAAILASLKAYPRGADTPLEGDRVLKERV